MSVILFKWEAAMPPSEVSKQQIHWFKECFTFKNIHILQNQVKRNKGDQHVLCSSSTNTIRSQHWNIDRKLVYIAHLNQWDTSRYSGGFLLEDNNISTFSMCRQLLNLLSHHYTVLAFTTLPSQQLNRVCLFSALLPLWRGFWKAQSTASWALRNVHQICDLRFAFVLGFQISL